MAEAHFQQEEHLDVITKTGEKTGLSKPRFVPFPLGSIRFQFPPQSNSWPIFYRIFVWIECRRLVHRDGDYHRAVHVWVYSESTQELLLQKRADCKASWPGKWDISSAGHISAGESSLLTARYSKSWDIFQFRHAMTVWMLNLIFSAFLKLSWVSG